MIQNIDPQQRYTIPQAVNMLGKQLIQNLISNASQLPRDIPFLAVIAAFLFLDQTTKLAARELMTWPMFFPERDFIALTLYYNYGASGGSHLFETGYLIRMGCAYIAGSTLLYILAGPKLLGPIGRIGCAIAIAGPAGNTIDRITQGRVTDFIHLGPYDVIINIADIGIYIGPFLVLTGIGNFAFRRLRELRNNDGNTPTTLPPDPVTCR